MKLGRLLVRKAYQLSNDPCHDGRLMSSGYIRFRHIVLRGLLFARAAPGHYSEYRRVDAF